MLFLPDQPYVSLEAWKPPEKVLLLIVFIVFIDSSISSSSDAIKNSENDMGNKFIKFTLPTGKGLSFPILTPRSDPAAMIWNSGANS